MITGSIIIKSFNFTPATKSAIMIRFFQVLFLVASIVVIVLNILSCNKYIEGKKEGGKPHPVGWFNFILTSLVAIGCALNIIMQWIQKG